MGKVKKQPIAGSSTFQSKEDAIRKAIKLTEQLDSKGQQLISIHEAAETCNIAYSTLRDRIAGAKSRREAHYHQQALSPEDEKVLMRWIGLLETSGFPPRLSHVREAAGI